MKVTTDALEKQDSKTTPQKVKRGMFFRWWPHTIVLSLSFLTDLSLVLCFDIIEASEASKEHMEAIQSTDLLS